MKYRYRTTVKVRLLDMMVFSCTVLGVKPFSAHIYITFNLPQAYCGYMYRYMYINKKIFNNLENQWKET